MSAMMLELPDDVASLESASEPGLPSDVESSSQSPTSASRTLDGDCVLPPNVECELPSESESEVNIPNAKVRKRQHVKGSSVSHQRKCYLNSFATPAVVHDERVEAALKISVRHSAQGYDDHIAELFSPPRVCPIARKYGLRAQLSVDLLSGYDLLDIDTQAHVLQELLKRRVQVLVTHQPNPHLETSSDLSLGTISSLASFADVIFSLC